MRLKSARNIHIISVLKIYFQKWGGVTNGRKMYLCSQV